MHIDISRDSEGRFVAAVVETDLGKVIARSDGHRTRAAAIADAWAQYEEMLAAQEPKHQ
jgi:uncharacterized protein YegP (UPF0339 family)